MDQRYRFASSRLRDLRKQVGLTQGAVAQLIGVGQTAVSQWELGRVNPSTENLMRLADILQCAPMDLIEEPAEVAG